MDSSQFHYLPLTPGFFSILVGIFVVVLVMLQLGALRYAYMQLGVSSGAAMLLLAASLVGSYFNVPVTELPAHHVVQGQVIDFFGMRYVVPVMVHTPGTVIAVNIGGAVIPTLMSLYILIRYELWGRGALATAGVALVVHWLAHPIPGLGIAVPIFVPAMASAIVAWLLSRASAARLAYVAGSLGTLIGADLTNLGHIAALGPPIASIGGAGTFDGIFLTGIVAVLLASFTRGSAARAPRAE
ncbi:MAG TPA: DUF1614 domain-containing protein [Pseudolabrys sp.]|nr:DUF1614 domain-containing protein [Pseudolabrys sp.]